MFFIFIQVRPDLEKGMDPNLFSVYSNNRRQIHMESDTPRYTLTSIMSLLFTEHLDIATQNFETKFSSVKLPRYNPCHP